MSTTVYFLSLSMLFGTILLMAAMVVFARVRTARSHQATEETLRKTAEDATAAQTAVASALSQVQAELAGLNGRLTSVEKILKEVG